MLMPSYIISGDSDFAMYVGLSGPFYMSDIMIKDLKLTITKDPIKSFKIYTGQAAVADKLEEILQPKLGQSPFENITKNDKGRVPKYPIYSGVADPMVRMLLALIVGCDACPGGVEGMGPKVAYETLQRFSAHSGRALLST
jgi:hypothetical protein